MTAAPPRTGAAASRGQPTALPWLAACPARTGKIAPRRSRGLGVAVSRAGTPHRRRAQWNFAEKAGGDHADRRDAGTDAKNQTEGLLQRRQQRRARRGRQLAGGVRPGLQETSAETTAGGSEMSRERCQEHRPENGRAE